MTYQQANAISDFRGVSSTAKLPLSKRGLVGSNPTAPARYIFYRETYMRQILSNLIVSDDTSF